MEKTTKEDIKKVLESKVMIKILYLVVILIITMLIFYAGILVGFHKASYGLSWEKHYNENFGFGPRNTVRTDRMMEQIGMIDDFPNAHGAIGKIIKIELPNIIVQDKDNTEKVLSINTDTKIEESRTEVIATDLKINDFVVVIGTPNDKGIIEAKFIRVMPAPELLK